MARRSKTLLAKFRSFFGSGQTAQDAAAFVWDVKDVRSVMHLVSDADDVMSEVWSGHPGFAADRPARRPLTTLDDPAIKIAMLARRSYGKSTLLNGLLNRRLLFTNRKQANSFPIYLLKAEADRGEILHAGGRKERIAVDADAIEAATKQFGTGRNINPRTVGVENLTLGMRDWPLPSELTLIDLAGFDDSVELDPAAGGDALETLRREGARLRNVALAEADAVIFVLRSQIALGQLERTILAEIYRSKGPCGVIPVFNIEVALDPGATVDDVRAAAAAAFSRPCVADAQAAYARFLSEVGIDPARSVRPIEVAALPAMLRPDAGDFGIAPLKAQLAAACTAPDSLDRTSRCFSAGRVLQQANRRARALGSARMQYEQLVKANTEIAARNQAAVRSWNDYLQSEAEDATIELCDTFASEAIAAFKIWVEEPGSYWQTHDRLNVALNAAEDRAAAATIQARISAWKAAFDERGEGVKPQLLQALQRAYAKRYHTVLSHDPNIGFWDQFWGRANDMAKAGWKAFCEDVDDEIAMTRGHWASHVDDVRSALEANLPPPPREVLNELPPCPVKLSAAAFGEAFEALDAAMAWGSPSFREGLSSQLDPIPKDENPRNEQTENPRSDRRKK